MTALEAFSKLDDWTYGHQMNDYEEIDEALKVLHKLVIKTIPKKAIGGTCPICHCAVEHLDTGSIDGISKDYFCSGCGQRIE